MLSCTEVRTSQETEAVIVMLVSEVTLWCFCDMLFLNFKNVDVLFFAKDIYLRIRIDVCLLIYMWKMGLRMNGNKPEKKFFNGEFHFRTIKFPDLEFGV